MSIPKPAPNFFMLVPTKRVGETEAQFQERVKEYEKGMELSSKPADTLTEPEKKAKEEWDKLNQNKDVFILPKDAERLKKFMADNPDAKLRLNAGDRDGMLAGIRELYNLDPNFVNKMTQVHLRDEKRDITEPREIQKAKETALPHLAKPKPH